MTAVAIPDVHADTVYQVTSLSHQFSGGAVEALADVDLHIRRGQFATFIGPSGCGKSTLLSIMAGLLEPTAGSVTLDQHPLDGPPDNVGIMFQTATLLPWRTTLENILLPLELRDGKRGASSYMEAAKSLLERVGLADFGHAYPHELSGGMRQRAAICRMLINEPDVLLLDEPFGALDELTRERMDLELQTVTSARDATVILVTHSISEAVLLSDVIYAMSARPGTIFETIEIELERPRSADTMLQPEFAQYANRVRQALNRSHDDQGPVERS